MSLRTRTLVFLWFYLMGLAVGQTTLPNCTGQPPALQSVVNNLNGEAFSRIRRVCISSSTPFEVTLPGLVGGSVLVRSSTFQSLPDMCAGVADSTNGTRTVRVDLSNVLGSSGVIHLTYVYENGSTLNFSLQLGPSNGILAFSTSPVVAAIGTSVDLTWIFFRAQTSFILTHNEAVYNIPNLLSMFDLFSVVGASDVCVGGQSFTVVNVSIPNVTSAHAGNYILNSTGALFAASVFLSVQPSIEPSLTISSTIAVAPTSTSTSVSLLTSNTPTIPTTNAPITVPIIAGVIIVAVLIITVVIIAIAAIVFVWRSKRTGSHQIFDSPTIDGSPPSAHSRNGRVGSGGSQSMPLINNQHRTASTSTRSGSFSSNTNVPPPPTDYTGVYAIEKYVHIKDQMLKKYGDQVRDLKDKDEVMAAALEDHCKEIIAFTGSNGNGIQFDTIFREVESRGIPCREPKFVRVVFADKDLADDHCVETAHVKVVFYEGSADEPDILGKLMMKSDLPVLKMNERHIPSDGNIDEPDFSPIQEEQSPLTSRPPSLTPAPPRGVSNMMSQDHVATATGSEPLPRKQQDSLQASAQSTESVSLINIEKLMKKSTELHEEELEIKKKELSLIESLAQNADKQVSKQSEQVILLTGLAVHALPPQLPSTTAHPPPSTQPEDDVLP